MHVIAGHGYLESAADKVVLDEVQTVTHYVPVS